MSLQETQLRSPIRHRYASISRQMSARGRTPTESSRIPARGFQRSKTNGADRGGEHIAVHVFRGTICIHPCSPRRHMVTLFLVDLPLLLPAYASFRYPPANVSSPFFLPCLEWGTRTSRLQSNDADARGTRVAGKIFGVCVRLLHMHVKTESR